MYCVMTPLDVEGRLQLTSTRSGLTSRATTFRGAEGAMKNDQNKRGTQVIAMASSGAPAWLQVHDM